MDSMIYSGRIRRYLKAPLYMIILFVVGDIAVLFLNLKTGLMMAVLIALYALIVWTYHRRNIGRLNQDIIDFAASYGTVQKEVINHLEIPYALLDANGRFLWHNEAFTSVAGENADYQKSVTSLFGEINKDLIQKIGDDPMEMHLGLDDRRYRVTIQKLSVGGFSEKHEDLLSVRMDMVLALMLFDETEIDALRTKNREQKLVVGQVSIDNYEETVESVEAVRRSLLTALIDRKINKYFLPSDALVRKTERDKYLVLFQQKYLKKMEDDKFSILDDIKTTKVGNDNEVTLSIGLGLGGDSYVQNSEYARTAMDLALGRGGSQAVVKNAADVSYYGSRGREIERNTRVKARVKAQALREIMSTRDRILVMGHQISDVDVFGSAMGIYVAAREMGKEAQIVLDTVTSSLRPLVAMFTPENGYPEDMIITREQAIALCDRHTLVIVVDTNRPSYTECPELLKKSNHIVVFDHHRQSDEVVQNPVLSYIEPYASSACEMIAEVLQYFSDKVQLRPKEADCIYAGILIDTDNFVMKVGVRTFEASAYLRRCGADVTRVRKLLREDMGTYKARAKVVRDSQVYRRVFAISVCDDGAVESPTIVGAQAANELLDIVGIKASFVLTPYHGKVYISSRSLDEIDVQEIMERLGGGGHLNIAGAQIEGASVGEVKSRLTGILDQMIEEGVIKL